MLNIFRRNRRPQMPRVLPEAYTITALRGIAHKAGIEPRVLFARLDYLGWFKSDTPIDLPDGSSHCLFVHPRFMVNQVQMTHVYLSDRERICTMFDEDGDLELDGDEETLV